MFRLLLILVVLGCLALLVAYKVARGAVRHRNELRHTQELIEENQRLDELLEKQYKAPSAIFGGRERRK
jgi:hypothetical protein